MPILKTDKKRDGLVGYRVIINYKTSDGKYKKKERTVYGLSEAREAEKNLARELSESKGFNMSVKELADEYMAAKKHELRESSYLESQKNIRLYILPELAKVKIGKLSPASLQKWKNTLNGTELSVATKQKAFTVFRAALNYAVKMQYIASNPLKIVGNFKSASFSAPSQSIQYYTAVQFSRYKATFERQCKTVADWGFYVFFMFAYYTGMRKGEINALRWTDIDGNVIHVTKSVNMKSGAVGKDTPPKNKSSIRDIQAPSPLVKILSAHKERCSKIPGFSESWRICGGPECLKDTTIDKKNRSVALAAGLPRIRVHDFRHSHASLLANEGINIQEVARRLGHSNIEITWQTYAHLYPREEERALKILNKIE